MRKKCRTIAIVLYTAALGLVFSADPSFAGSATWLLNPGTGDWNTAGNWTPVTVPNGSGETATFSTSNTTAVSISTDTEALTVFFAPAASAFTITAGPALTLTINSGGINNTSAFTQNFVTAVNAGGQFGQIHFINSATAGTMTVFNNTGGIAMNAVPGFINFYNTSSAGSATFNNNGGTFAGAGGGGTQFIDTGTTAATGLFHNNGGTVSGSFGGATNFVNGTAANGTFINNPGTVVGAGQGRTIFQNSATAANGMSFNNGATVAGATGGSTEFLDTSNGANSTVTSFGGTVAGAAGGLTLFSGNAANIFQSSNAGNAFLIANGGTNGGDGGLIEFIFFSDGGTSRVQLNGNGHLDISFDFASTVTIGSLEGNGNVFLGDGNLAIGSNDMDTTFSGVIQDGGLSPGTGGSITKVGTGMLTLTNDSTYTGGTTIESGVLAIGSLNAMGTGDVTVNGGTLQTFNGPRPMAVGGNYVQNSGGTLRLQIGGLASGSESDFLTVNGSASLGGTLALVRINNFNPAPGDRVEIIGDLGGHSGTFDTVTSDFAGLLQPVPHYDEALDIYIRFEIVSFSALSNLTPNQLAVAHELNEVRNDPRASDLIDFLVTEPFRSLPHDFDLIAPEELASIYEIGFSQAVVQNMNLQHRMDDIRAGSNGFCANGFAAQVSGKDYSKGSDGKAALDNNPTPAFVPSPENRWGVFVSGSGAFVNVGNRDDNAHGYDITTGNVTVGVDYRVCDHFAIGLDGGYSGGTADLVDRGRVEVDGGKAGAYATVYGYKFLGADIHIDGAVSGGWNSYDTRRTGLDEVTMLVYNDTARGSTNGSEFNAMLSYGGDYHFGCLLVGTWSSLQYTDIHIDQFTEQGSLAPLQIQGQDEYSFRGTSGIRVAYDLKAGHTIFRPEMRAAWQHESGDRAYPIEARFASGAGDVFTVHGPAVGRDAALVDAGLSVQWNHRWSAYVYYDGVLGRSNYDNHAVSGGFRISF